MKKTLLLIMMVLFAAFATMSAQEMEKTDSPWIESSDEDNGKMVSIVHYDPEAVIYWRYSDDEGMTWTEWMTFEEPLLFSEIGWIYRLEAYAISPGKSESDHIFYEFQVIDFNELYYHRQIADFGVDGIYYKITSDSTVNVSLNDTYDYPYTEPFGWELYSVGPYAGDVVIPATVEYEGKTYVVEGIDSYAFINCPLTSITLPNGLKSISKLAFLHATIESGSIFIPVSVSTIETGAFADCYDLSSVQVDAGNPVYDSRDDCNAIVETATNKIVCAFNSTVIPSTVTAIGNNAYAGDAYSVWGYYSGCFLTDFVVPNTVQTIGDWAFYLCSSLNSVTLSEELKSIGNYAFAVCVNLKNITIPDKVTTIGNGAFRSCYNLTSATMGSSVTSIGDEAFYRCSSLTDLSIGNSVTSIGKSAFYGCDALTSITFPNSVSTIGSLAFNECSSLASVTFGNSLSSIGSSAFSDCSSLISITIPQSVTSIGNHAFYRCYGLQRITCMPTTPLNIDSECFRNNLASTYDQVTLFVPYESLEAYRAHEEWGKFTHIVPFIGAGPGDVNGDGKIAINDVTNIIDLLLSGEDVPAWADVNGDGQVTISDVTALIDLLLSGE